MTRMIPPSIGLRRVDVESSHGTKVVHSKDGVFDVSNPATVRKLKEEGFTIASASGVTKGSSSLGYNCSKCGFGSWFAVCSKCGHNNKE